MNPDNKTELANQCAKESEIYKQAYEKGYREGFENGFAEAKEIYNDDSGQNQ